MSEHVNSVQNVKSARFSLLTFSLRPSPASTISWNLIFCKIDSVWMNEFLCWMFPGACAMMRVLGSVSQKQPNWQAVLKDTNKKTTCVSESRKTVDLTALHIKFRATIMRLIYTCFSFSFFFRERKKNHTENGTIARRFFFFFLKNTCEWSV